MRLTSDLKKTLIMAAEAAAGAAEPWWIIGSATAALHGLDVEVSDVDLLMSAGDAERTLGRLGIPARRGSRSRLFRSQVFGTWREPPLPLEIMGGFHLRVEDSWQSVWPETREPFQMEGRTLFAPSAAEFASLLRSFGRPKDLVRAQLLEGRRG